MNTEAKDWYQLSLEDFKAGFYQKARQKAKECISLLNCSLQTEEFNWLLRIYKYSLHFNLANKLYELEYFNDALIFYASLYFKGAPNEILERLKTCRRKSVYPLLENTKGDYYESLHSKEQLIPVKQDGKWGYTNENNEITIPFQFDHARTFSENLAVVKKNGKYGVIDIEGHQVIPFKYDFIYSGNFSGMICVELNGREYYINDKDTIIYVPND